MWWWAGVSQLMGGVTVTLAPYAGDETEVSTTSTTAETKKTCSVVRDSSNLPVPKTAVFEVEGYIDTSGETLTVTILVDDTSQGTLEFTETSYTKKALVVDVSGWADGIHTIEMQMHVSGGTGYNRLFEVWLIK